MIFENENAFEAACGAVVTEISALMNEKSATAAAAESLTGGLISSEIVRVPGVSSWFAEGCVTYTDGAKMRRLTVSPVTLAQHTAVSRETAREMAEGMRASSGADIAVSATGLAGPGPDELGRPAGLVFIGGAAPHGSVTKELALSGSRLEIRQQAAYEALKLMLGLAKTL
ncbi:MAG: nicotinamide-nucleotide amidohydrolase family protein [Clostridia bacterium]|nr:nicotinamide-nucleotide amidohydrolase family protein [Clostridia bacterium]